MPQLLEPLAEAGLKDETLPGVVEWPPEKIHDFFEYLINSKVMDRLQSFVLKGALEELSTASNKKVRNDMFLV